MLLSRTNGLLSVGASLVPVMFGAITLGDLDLSWYTVDAGGRMLSTGGVFELAGTIGQADVGRATGGEFALSGGFWFETPPGDCDSTGVVDLLDYDGFEPCVMGPDAAVGPGCECFDMDRNGTVDLLDFAAVQMAFTGS